MPTVETRNLRGGGVRYVVRVRNPAVEPGAKGYFTSATYATQPEAEQFVRDVDQRGVEWALAEYHRDQENEEELRLDEWAEIHFKALTKPSAGTVARYQRIYRATWHEPLGHYRLSQIGRVEVAHALNAVADKGVSDKTVLNAWGVLTHMLKMAAQDNLITRSPTIGVSPPRRTEHEKTEHRYLTLAEFAAVYRATPDYWKPLVMTLGGTGIRWGEAAALTVGDIDVDLGVVRITKAERQDPANPSRTIVGPPKSKKAKRTVTLPNEVIVDLEPLLDRKRNERLFLPPKGGPLRHRTFYRDIWLKKCLPNSGIREPYPRLHDLRHSQVAWLIAAGTSLPVIQARLGHEKIATTVDTYGHLLPELQRSAAEAANLVLGGVRELG